jgi:hypothetical protein
MRIGASGGTRSLHASVDAADLAELARQLLLLQCAAQPPEAGLEAGCGRVPPSQQPQPPTTQGEQLRRSQLPSEASTAAAAGGPAAVRLVVAAYSYGTLVAARALPQLRPHVAAVAMVAMPLGGLPGGAGLAPVRV